MSRHADGDGNRRSPARRIRRAVAVLRGRPDLPAAALAATAAVVAVLVSVELFPHGSTNHDEGVYLRQAAMLLEGRLFLRPPVIDALRPWFFVREDPALYPKYTPVPAAVFAVGELLGTARLALAGVAAGVVALTYRAVREAFDARTGLLAAALVLASPLFLVQSGVFLPYLPTTLLNLAFAAAYLTADRTGGRRAAAVAGLAVGAAFLARPYSAVLFAAPFVAHALWTLRTGDAAVVVRQVVVAAGGLAGVATTLAYNAVVTGDPLLFPYLAFAPMDGLGFGRRAIAGYERVYSPELALRANTEVLRLFATRWFVAGALGTAASLAGLAVAVRRGLDARRAAVAGLLVSIPLGNVYFWGNLNVLGDLANPDDGLVSTLGTYYHTDLLVPAAAFAAVGLFAAAGLLRRAVDAALREATAGPSVERRRRAVAGALAAVLVLATVGGGAAAVAADPIRENAAIGDRIDAAYEPTDGLPDDALLFLPTPYGDWLGHPFQYLRNDPGYDDGPVYALREDQFDVVDAFPDRRYHRYGYRGEWAPFAGSEVEPVVRPVEHAAGPAVRQRLVLGVPEFAERVSIRLSGAEGEAYATATPAGEDLALAVVVRNGTATLTGDGVEPATLPVAERDALELRALVDFGTGGGFTYRTEMPVERTDGGARALTPYAEVCLAPDRCGGEAAHVPGSYDRPGVALRTNVTAVGGETTDASDGPETAARTAAAAATRREDTP